MNFVYRKSFRIVSIIIAIIFTISMGYLNIYPNVVPFVDRVFLILFLFYALFSLVHSSFSLTNNGFMGYTPILMGAIIHVVVFLFALTSKMWLPLIWIAGSLFLFFQIMIYKSWPPDRKEI
jgi:hypothetical protein